MNAMIRLAHVPVALGAAAMLAPATAGAQDESSRDWTAIERCAAIPDADARHLCLDAALVDLGLLAGQSARTAQEEIARREVDPASPPARSAPVQVAQAASRPTPATPVAAAEPAGDLAPTTIRAARVIRGNVEVAAMDGTAWRSTSSQNFRRPPREGARFQVSRGALGSYNCQVEDSTFFKCEPMS